MRKKDASKTETERERERESEAEAGERKIGKGELRDATNGAFPCETSRLSSLSSYVGASVALLSCHPIPLTPCSSRATAICPVTSFRP